ncbi:MAG: electron transfer flavoprotein subunit alpha/FixB family protein [Actinomycetota bacterium]
MEAAVSGDVLVLAEVAGGSYLDVAFELTSKARQLATAWGGRVLSLVVGPPPQVGDLDADVLLNVDHPALATYGPEAYLAVLQAVLEERHPKLVLLANTTAGMDLGAALSIRWGKPIAAYAVDVAAEGDDVVVTSQLYGGHLLAEVLLEGGQGIATVVAGSFAVQAHPGGPRHVVMEALPPPPSLDALRTRTLEVPPGEDEDIDIAKAAILVSLGRGMKSGDNVALAKEFADAIGAPLSGTSQVCDLGWLPRTRHVGKSGVKVRPRAYLTFGISGAPEHLEGIGDAELIIACNTDPEAPIFNVAHFGTTLDALQLLHALVERARP